MAPFDVASLATPGRLAAVERTRRLLAGLTMPFDAYAQLGARFLGAPIGAICLVGGDIDILIGAYGTPNPLTRNRRVPLAYSLGKHVVANDDLLAVPDLSRDPGLHDHALLREFGIRSFLGAPLRGKDGHPVGSMLVGGYAVREWTEAEKEQLVEMAAVLSLPPAELPVDKLPDLYIGPFIDAVLEAFLAVDIDGVIRGWNPAAETLFGWTANEAAGRRLADLTLIEPAEAAFGTIFEALATTERPQHRRTGMARHRDGHEFPVEAYLTCVPTASGPLMCGFFIDATEHVALSDTASRQGHFLNALLDSLEVGVCACDTDGNVVVANRALREWYGLPEDWQPFPVLPASESSSDLQGNLLNPESTPLVRAWRGETVRGQLLRIPSLTKTPRMFMANANPFSDDEGQLLGAVAALHDVTERLQADRLRGAELKVVTTLAYSPHSVAAINEVLGAIGSALDARWGEAWLANRFNVLQPQSRWDPQHGSAANHSSWRGHSLAVRCHHSVGPVLERRPAIGTAAAQWQLAIPIRSTGSALGVLVLSGMLEHTSWEHDLGFSQAMAAHLAAFLASRQAAELSAELGRSRDDFLALAGHAIRTPLTAIGTYTELLEAGADSWPEDDKQLLATVSRNVDSLRAIIDDLLDLAAVESGHAATSVRPTDLADLIRTTMVELREVAGGNMVRLVDQLPEQIVVPADPRRMKQAVENLLSNAIKYSPDGGVVTVAANSKPDSVELTITDAGVGIPADERERLFRRFFRASNALDRGIPGTGLGLTLARAIVEQHHGTVALSPRKDGAAGTVARICLPLLPLLGTSVRS